MMGEAQGEGHTITGVASLLPESHYVHYTCSTKNVGGVAKNVGGVAKNVGGVAKCFLANLHEDFLYNDEMVE